MNHSNYGDSVKFYEKMAELHGQLKSYEEEQYHLQEEFTKLWPNSPRNRDPPLLRVDDDVPVQTPVPAMGLNSDTTISPSKSAVPYTLSVDDISAHEKRRKRNQIIVDKIKDLEANAAVFAARSEKLRIMRSEYEVLVKKYMDNRKMNVNANTNNLLPATNATLAALNQRFMTASPHPSVSIGVNTDITGPVKALEDTSEFNYFETPRTLDVQGSILNYSEAFKEAGNGGRFQIESKFASQTQYMQEKQDNLHDYYTIKPTNIAITNENTMIKYPNINTTQHIIRSSQFLSSNALNTGEKPDLRRLHAQVTTDKDINVDTDDSLAEKSRYHRHNPYFDMSTTSESDLTSAQNALQKKSLPLVPININLDDSTQSDTFSLSMSVHTPQAQKAMDKVKTNTARILATVLTTDGSESTTSHQNQYQHSRSHPRAHYQAESQSTRRPSLGMTMTVTAQKETEIILLTEGKEILEELKDLENEKNENELEHSSLSDSLTTSPNDSVMDSVQNRTFNDSLPHDIDNGPIDHHEQEHEPIDSELLNPLRIPIPSFNVPVKGQALEVKERNQNQHEENEENERRIVNARKVVENIDNFGMKNDPNPKNLHTDSKITSASVIKPTTSTNNSYNHNIHNHASSNNNGFNLNPGLLPCFDKDKGSVDLKVTTSKNADGKIIMSPLDVLNNFREIEEEFTVGNGTKDDEVPTWEKDHYYSLLGTKTDNNTSDPRGQLVQREKELRNSQDEKEIAEITEIKKPMIQQQIKLPTTQEQDPPRVSSPSSSPKVSSTASITRPKTVAGQGASGTGTGGPRRVKLKLDYEDSDSEESASGPLQAQAKKIGNQLASIGSLEQVKKDNVDEIDDDFDDFFDI